MNERGPDSEYLSPDGLTSFQEFFITLVPPDVSIPRHGRPADRLPQSETGGGDETTSFQEFVDKKPPEKAE